MARKSITLSFLLVVGSCPLAVMAEETRLPGVFNEQGISLYDTQSTSDPVVYEINSKRNQDIINDAVVDYMEDTLDSMGSTGTALKYTGAAAYMVVKKARFNLNDSKTMSIEMNDMVDSDREIVYKYKIKW